MTSLVDCFHRHTAGEGCVAVGIEPDRRVRPTGVHGGSGAQAPRAAIIEDDARQRLLILSSTDEGTVLVYRMGDLPVNVAQRFPQALACSRTRHCQNQRNDPAGELGCLAICLLEHLTE